jgi:hypothetical protein
MREDLSKIMFGAPAGMYTLDERGSERRRVAVHGSGAVEGNANRIKILKKADVRPSRVRSAPQARSAQPLIRATGARCDHEIGVRTSFRASLTAACRSDQQAMRIICSRDEHVADLIA